MHARSRNPLTQPLDQATGHSTTTYPPTMNQRPVRNDVVQGSSPCHTWREQRGHRPGPRRRGGCGSCVPLARALTINASCTSNTLRRLSSAYGYGNYILKNDKNIKNICVMKIVKSKTRWKVKTASTNPVQNNVWSSRHSLHGRTEIIHHSTNVPTARPRGSLKWGGPPPHFRKPPHGGMLK